MKVCQYSSKAFSRSKSVSPSGLFWYWIKTALPFISSDSATVRFVSIHRTLVKLTVPKLPPILLAIWVFSVAIILSTRSILSPTISPCSVARAISPPAKAPQALLASKPPLINKSNSTSILLKIPLSPICLKPLPVLTPDLEIKKFCFDFSPQATCAI